MACVPCELKRQRLRAKLDAIKERAINHGKENGHDIIIVFQVLDEEDDEPRYGFGISIPAGAIAIELLRVN